MIKATLGSIGGKLVADLFETTSLLLGRVKVNEYGLNALLQLDIVAKIELPMGSICEEMCELLVTDFNPLIQNTLDEKAPMAAVLDSGIFSGNPLLRDVIVCEEDFDQTEQTTNDMNGHGTGVAGIVAYGDFLDNTSATIYKPLVRVCNGKIMHNQNMLNNNYPSFRDDKRPEVIVRDAIEYFYNEYGCRIFNLSAGNSDYIYNGGRQMAWAEVLDNLAKKLDIVIVISAGNVGEPQLHEVNSREGVQQNVRNQLFDAEHRLIDPATAALCVTVGAITRNDEPEVTGIRQLRISAGPKNSPSVFTRIGYGVNKSVKPEFVDFGGNFAIHQIQRGHTKWYKNDRELSEKTLNNTNDRLFKCYCGTSFSAPRVTHLAARIERELEKQNEKKPTANLIRAMLANSASITNEMKEWANESVDAMYEGKKNIKQERRMRLLGYGQVSEEILSSKRNAVTLFAEDKLPLRSFHLYKIPVPSEFLKVKGNKRISVSLAYNPSTRLSRKEYLSNNLWMEIYRRIDEDELALCKTKMESDSKIEIPSRFDKNKADFLPGGTEIDTSTLQQRLWCKGEKGGDDLLWNEEEPYIWILVAGKEKFNHAEIYEPQDYALVITFSYDGKEDIQLHNKLKERVHERVKVRQDIRERAQVRR